jgi:hypothetical protein
MAGLHWWYGLNPPLRVKWGGHENVFNMRVREIFLILFTISISSCVSYNFYWTIIIYGHTCNQPPTRYNWNIVESGVLLPNTHPVINNPCKVCQYQYTGWNNNTGKPVHVITSIKQSPVWKYNLFLSCHAFFHWISRAVKSAVDRPEWMVYSYAECTCL